MKLGSFCLSDNTNNFYSVHLLNNSQAQKIYLGMSPKWANQNNSPTAWYPQVVPYPNFSHRSDDKRNGTKARSSP